jgi:hypothetical protein
MYMNNQFPNGVFEFHCRGFIVDTITYVGPNARLARYTGIDSGERLVNVKQRLEMFRQNVILWKQEVTKAASDLYTLYQNTEEAFWRTMMADRTMHWASVPSSSHIYFDTFMGRAEVPTEFVEAHPEVPAEDMKRVYIRPFTNSAVPRCHGRSFIITSKGYLGIAPIKTKAGDLVCVLDRGIVPFVLRDAVDSEGRSLGHYNFVGESYIHGIMDGEATRQAGEEDVKVMVLN